MKTFKVRVYDIDYCVEEQDVCQEIDNDPEIEEDSEEYYEAIDKRIDQIKSELPQELIFTIECDKQDLEDQISEAIGNQTGWLVYGYNYDIL